jgi:uncharacterized damage-inducible protein DinB
MLKETLLKLIDYNYWANGLILKFAEKLSNEQRSQKTAHSHSSLHEILIHIMFAEWVWRLRLTGNSPDFAMIKSQLRSEDYFSLKEVLEKWFDEELLLETFTYTTTRGEEFKNVYYDIFTHLVFHGMQHRAEAASILHNFGQSPGDIDFLRYLRQR